MPWQRRSCRLFTLPLAGTAEASEPDAPRSDAVVRPLELLELVPADYPANALAERREAVVTSGANLDVGFVSRRWANRLLLRAFVTDFDKEFQHNQVMTVPYGGATYGEWSAGVSVRYDAPLGHGARIETVLGYARTDGHFLDVTKCVYDWFGRCVRERRQPGETDTRPTTSSSATSRATRASISGGASRRSTPSAPRPLRPTSCVRATNGARPIRRRATPSQRNASSPRP